MGQPQNGRHAGPQRANVSSTRDTPLLASHYVFDPRCCMPARGNEKPDAEGTVKAVQRRFATPVPRVADRDELNLFFRKCCAAERERTVQSLLGPFLIKTRLAEDLAAATPLPKHPLVLPFLSARPVE